MVRAVALAMICTGETEVRDANVYMHIVNQCMLSELCSCIDNFIFKADGSTPQLRTGAEAALCFLHNLCRLDDMAYDILRHSLDALSCHLSVMLVAKSFYSDPQYKPSLHAWQIAVLVLAVRAVALGTISTGKALEAESHLHHLCTISTLLV